MIDRIVDLALRQRAMVILMALGLMFWGYMAARDVPIDAFPDVTPVQVEIFTEAPGLAAEEVEQLITFPLEVSMSGLPSITDIRSVSKFGISVVTVVFDEGTDIYFARQLVHERVAQAAEQLEGIADPEMGPITTGMGQIYQYVLESDRLDIMELRTLQDWLVKFQLRTVRGVTDVISFGGLVQQYQVLVDPNRLLAYDVTLDEVMSAVRESNENAGGQFIVKGAEEYTVRGVGWIRTVRDLESVAVTNRGETPVYVRDIAHVKIGPEIRRGVVTMNGKGEVVSGIVLLLKGENSAQVIKAVQEKVEEINRALPEGVHLRPYYDQAELVSQCVETVTRALKQGGLLIIVVLLLFLGNFRSALIVTLALPFSVLLSFVLMREQGISANLMSLGGLAIGLGMMVDGTVVMVENVYRHLTENRDGRSVLSVVSEAAREVGSSIFFAVLIIVVVFLPLFTLRGVEGKMFKPMAFSLAFAMLGSLVFALTIAPVLCSLILGRTGEERQESWFIALLKRLYRRTLGAALRHHLIVVTIAALVLLAGFALLPLLGGEFLPELDEGSSVIRVTYLPSISLAKAADMTTPMEEALLEFPEVVEVVSRVGRDEVGGCAEPVSNTEILVTYKPRSEWTVRSKQELVEAMAEKLQRRFPGMLLNFSQPIATRVDELLSGIRAQVAIKIFGDDMSVLEEKAQDVARLVSGIRGAADVQAEQVSGMPQLKIVLDRGQLARYGVSISHVQEIVRAGIGGEVITEVFEGQRRSGVLVRFQERFRDDLEAIRRIPVSSPKGPVPLGQLARIAHDTGPVQISREQAQRRIVVQCNARGRDMQGFVQEAQRLVSEQVDLPPGYFVEWGGQFELRQRANARLRLVVPVTIGLILLLLFSCFGNVRHALLIILNVPFALVGGILALFLSGQNLSVAASIGFIALFGIAVLNGVVMISYINDIRRRGANLQDAVVEGALLRLRPVLMTALTTLLGLSPLLFAHGTGSEIQRPLATVVVGGLITSTALTLLVLPTVYRWFESRVPEVEL